MITVQHRLDKSGQGYAGHDMRSQKEGDRSSGKANPQQKSTSLVGLVPANLSHHVRDNESEMKG